MKKRRTITESAEATFPAIEGSKLRRAFCRYCLEPIRITIEYGEDVLRGREVPECNDCSGGNRQSKADIITPRQRYGLGKTGA